MSNLEGTLSPSCFGKVLNILIKRNPAATLLVSDGENEKVVYFSTGGVRVYASAGRAVARIEDYLVDKGLVAREDVERAQRLVQERRGVDLPEVLEQLELFPREKFHQVVSRLIFFELCDLVTWENAIYEFYVGNPPPEIFDDGHPALFSGLDVKKFATQVLKWTERWSQVKAKLYSERLRPKLAVDESVIDEQDEIDPVKRRLLGLANGECTLREIAQVAQCDFPRVAEVVYGGMEQGLLTGALVPRTAPDSPQELLAEVERLEVALDRAINAVLIHKRIAMAYERLDERDLASRHYESIGDIQTEQGHIGRAAESFRRAVSVAPQNISAHESLIERLRDAGNDSQVLDEIFSLSKKLVTFGFVQRACDTLKAVVSKVPGRFDIQTYLGDVLVKLGRFQEAVSQYLGVASQKKVSGAVSGIEELYLKVLALDPINREARIGMARERNRRAGKSIVWIHRLTAAAAVLGLIGWIAVEVTSRVTWAQVEPEIERAMARRELDAGLEKLRSFSERFPGSLFATSLPSLELELYTEAYNNLEDDLRFAQKSMEDGWITRGKEHFRRVQKIALVSGQVERAGAGIRQCNILLEKWKVVQKGAERYLHVRHYERLFDVCRKIIGEFPEGADGLKVPFHITSDPPGAAIKVGGVPRGRTPEWITVRRGKSETVQLEFPGQPQKTLDPLDDRDSPFVKVELGGE